MAYYDNVPLINNNGDTYYPQTKTNSVYKDDGTSLDTILTDLDTSIDNHIADKANPHGVTKAQVGLGNVPNVATDDQTPTFTTSSTLTNLTSGEKISIAFGKISKAIASLISHIADAVSHITSTERTNWNTAYTNNHTHSNKTVLDNTTASYTTAEQTKLSGIATGANNYSLPIATSSVLGGVKSGTDITVDASGNVSVNDNSHAHTIANVTNLQTSLDAKVNTSSIGVASGVAQLDSSGKVPSAQLPSYVDDILDGTCVSATVFNDLSGTAYSPESGKIYVDTTWNRQYRWSGTAYVEISSSLALGETTSTAYAGDKGKAVTDNLATHIADSTKHITATERTNWNNASTNTHTHSNKAVLDATTASFTTADETKLDGIATGAEVNQNAFSNIVVGGTTVSADTKTDTLTLVAGTGITLTPNASTDTITITGVNQYTLPTATSSALGGVKSGTDINIDASGNVSVVDDSHSHSTSTISDFATTVGLNASLNTVDKATLVNAVNEVNSTSLKAGLGSSIGVGVPRNADLLGGQAKSYYEGLSKVSDDVTTNSYKFVMSNGALYLEQV